MGRITPIPREELPQYEPVFELVEAAMGFVPSSLPTMARIPALFEAFGQLAVTVTTRVRSTPPRGWSAGKHADAAPPPGGESVDAVS